ncbi:MAG: hypothetical protein ACLPYY_04070 [Acidimicrobiales bacterium]
MSETEISPTPEGRPPEGAGSTSPPDAARPAPQHKPKIGDTRPAPVVAPPPKPPAPVVPLVRPDPSAPKEPASSGAGTAAPAGGDADERSKPARTRRRPGRERRSKQVGRYLVCVHVQPHMTQIAMLEGRTLVEHYVSRAADDTNQIDGNV